MKTIYLLEDLFWRPYLGIKLTSFTFIISYFNLELFFSMAFSKLSFFSKIRSRFIGITTLNFIPFALELSIDIGPIRTALPAEKPVGRFRIMVSVVLGFETFESTVADNLVNPYWRISGKFLRPFYYKTHPSKNHECLFSFFFKTRVVS